MSRDGIIRNSEDSKIFYEDENKVKNTLHKIIRGTIRSKELLTLSNC